MAMKNNAHKSGKEYDPTAWAAQRRSAVETATKLRVERKTNAFEAVDCTFTPELIARKPSPGTLPVEMDTRDAPREREGREVNARDPRDPRDRGGNGRGAVMQTPPASLDKLASDSLDKFYVEVEGTRIQGANGQAHGQAQFSQFSNGAHGQDPGRRGPSTGPAPYAPVYGSGYGPVLSPSADSLGVELKRRQPGAAGGGSGGGSPFVSKFGQELFNESILAQPNGICTGIYLPVCRRHF